MSFYNYLLLRFKFDRLKRTVPWCDQLITIFHISFAVTPSNAQPHTRQPMRINVPHHTSELHYFILHNMLLICCSYRSNSRTVCEEAKPTYHGYGTPKCHQEPKQDCKQVFFLTLQAELTNCHSMAVKTVSTSKCCCYYSKTGCKADSQRELQAGKDYQYRGLSINGKDHLVGVINW